ncbi:hypothetical protein Q5Y75_23900 [Ruegeria sp. 2205SS24-7]|uniref:hypothetical protein n=1 Tax=Ruegeria discodermiae TaxID=3064389 RepID=UPI00274250AB|nr:hypothetical protein [Ruegeria sp. 2205SS24-7]MDP5220238.1 hypothetical protein [Ruegeria sp. 2205SS24-7]
MQIDKPESLGTREFVSVPLRFGCERFRNVFAHKNNKTLRETLLHKRYKKLSSTATERFRASLDLPLGDFLLNLKKSGDAFYLSFLNKYGDLEFSEFAISDPEFWGLRGVYAYFVDQEIMYIGRCRDAMKKRINQGYGKIHPKNCYLDGQATNCHLNSRITSSERDISLWLLPMHQDDDIATLESQLIAANDPPWNLRR